MKAPLCMKDTFLRLPSADEISARGYMLHLTPVCE